MGKPLRLFEELLTITAFVSLKVLVVNPSGLLLYAHKVTNYIQTETYPHICMCCVCVYTHIDRYIDRNICMCISFTLYVSPLLYIFTIASCSGLAWLLYCGIYFYQKLGDQ
jgi:hypothetical protein